MGKGMGGHESANMITDVWLTPPGIVQALGTFDLDPCSPVDRPWDTAARHLTIHDNGLFLPWEGRVWLNPPYGREIEDWMEKMAMHRNGIALIFARTDTKFFQRYIFPVADSILFIEGRIRFYNRQGIQAKSGGGAPSVLISYGQQNMEALAECGIKGKHVLINSVPVIVIGKSPQWKNVVQIAMVRLNGKASLQQIYDLVEVIAPDRVKKNQHFKAKVRQQLQFHFERISKGYYSTKTAA